MDYEIGLPYRDYYRGSCIINGTGDTPDDRGDRRGTGGGKEVEVEREAGIPAIDASRHAETEIATFALG